VARVKYLLTFGDYLRYKRFLLRNFIPHYVLICGCNLPVYSRETAIWLAPMSTRIVQLALLDVLFVSVAIKKFNGVGDNLGKVKQTLIEKHY